MEHAQSTHANYFLLFISHYEKEERRDPYLSIVFDPKCVSFQAGVYIFLYFIHYSSPLSSLYCYHYHHRESFMVYVSSGFTYNILICKRDMRITKLVFVCQTWLIISVIDCYFFYQMVHYCILHHFL